MNLLVCTLKAIKEAGADGIRVKDICTQTGGSKSGILKILQSLQENELVRRSVGDVPKYYFSAVSNMDTDGQPCVDHRSTVEVPTVNHTLTNGQLYVDHRSTVGVPTVNHTLTIGQLYVDQWSTVGIPSVNDSPVNMLTHVNKQTEQTNRDSEISLEEGIQQGTSLPGLTHQIAEVPCFTG